MASTVGTILEWYDFALYAAASAIVFGPLFFSNQSETVATLASFATFGVGFAARPFGGLLVAHFGDRYGRKPTMIFTISMMGVSTLLIGCLPTYETAGVLAPVLLVVLRIVQGFGAGAEFAGAVTYVAESVPSARRGLFTAAVPAGAMAGAFLATLVFYLMSAFASDVLLTWGWRALFISAGALFLFAFFLRTGLAETGDFEAERKAGTQGRLPILDLLRNRPAEALIGLGCMVGPSAVSYTIATFSVSYIERTLGLSSDVGLLAVLIANCVAIGVLLISGRLSDRVGRLRVLVLSTVFTALAIFPFFALLRTRDTLVIVLTVVVTFAISYAVNFGPQGAFLAELFDTKYRFTGIVFCREISSVAFAGTAPFIATALVAAADGAPWGVAAYVSALSLVTLAAYYAAHRRRRATSAQPAIQNDMPAGTEAG
ncbi:MFS family permease [Thermocatellispora tengchongensis]|uniref:MFS family permease n=1 Tax=Thermocatellispora tengchongensis TaxID=1073253 RepID=A0A840PHL2_9ACTN|nr:MFS transporter [Thermocatellispora tengchongensis]MBB5138459.1 MFS family permease [Thermocatellispora tengchongensis]